MGLKQPASWRRIILIALVAAILRILLGNSNRTCNRLFWPKPRAGTGKRDHREREDRIGCFVAGVDVCRFRRRDRYRGYLLTRAADIGRRSAAAYWIGIVLVSILFGYGHYYKGASGVIDSGVAGLILGTAYMLAGRNLWASILAHGFIDTFGIIDAFFGWSN